MSDFLDNLVARSLSRVETVRPQVISIFEPPPVNSGAIFHDSTKPELPLVEREMENPIAERLGRVQSLWRGEKDQGAIAVEPHIPQERSESHVDSQPIPPVKTQGWAADESSAMTSYSPVEPSPTIPARTPSRAVRRKRAAVAPVITEEALGSNSPNEYNSDEKSRPTREPGAASSSTAHITPLRARELAKSLAPMHVGRISALVKSERKRSETPPTIETIVRKGQVEDEATPTHEAKTSQLRPASATQNLPSPQPKISPLAPIVPASIVVSPHVLPGPPHDDGAKEAPSIYVTIGRVEVRATVPPPVRSRPQPASAPAMSLNEYLRQRAAEDRR